MPYDQNQILETLIAAEEKILSAAKELEDHSSGIDLIEAVQLATRLGSLISANEALAAHVYEQLRDGRVLKNTEEKYEQIGGSSVASSLNKLSSECFAGGRDLRMAGGHYLTSVREATSVLIPR
ncbi:hypothetical protein [Leucobacter luti]|nr:hypothetical protein [Leucobacter luti]